MCRKLPQWLWIYFKPQATSKCPTRKTKRFRFALAFIPEAAVRVSIFVSFRLRLINQLEIWYCRNRWDEDAEILSVRWVHFTLSARLSSSNYVSILLVCPLPGDTINVASRMESTGEGKIFRTTNLFQSLEFHFSPSVEDSHYFGGERWIAAYWRIQDRAAWLDWREGR